MHLQSEISNTFMYFSLHNPIVHPYMEFKEVEKNEKIDLIQGWIDQRSTRGYIDLDTLIKLLKKSTKDTFNLERGYDLDESEITKDMDKSYITFHSDYGIETLGANNILIEFDDIYIEIGN